MPREHEFTTHTLQPPQLIETAADLAGLVHRLMQHARVAVDTESNSLYAYREQVCLIQFSIPDGDYLVDPLALENLNPLAPFFAATDIEKVFHAADYDLIVLKRDYGFTCGSLFDTMWAARVLGWPRPGLANLLEMHFGLHPNKKYQRYDWGRRPLDAKAVTYAQMDTHYLLALRDLQVEALKAGGRFEEAQEIFDYLRTHVPEASFPTVETTFWRIKGVRELNRAEKRALYKLHLWREHMAEQLDRPPVKVIGDRRLVRLARTLPQSQAQLSEAGLTPLQVKRFGRSVLQALHSRGTPPPVHDDNHERPPEAVLDRYQTLREWRKEIAAHRGVESDVILPNATLWFLARMPPQTLDDLLQAPGIGPWRQRHYGPDILGLLDSQPS
ncbi:MAG: HRDC domain-containing protein [Anaerolineae bacterium]|nr:HRDC domain-containing protein [Anaerolineae bacterium]